MKELIKDIAEMLKEMFVWFYDLVVTEMGYGTWLVLGLVGTLMFAHEIVVHAFVTPSAWLIYDVMMFKAMAALVVYTIKKEVLNK